MEKEETFQKQTPSFNRTKLTVGFQGTGQHEGKSLQELCESLQVVSITIDGKTFPRKVKTA